MFTHLHTHTEFSLLDGMSRIPQLFDRAQALGMEAIAMTDHGALYGALDFYREAKERGIKPIIGLEAYVAPESRHSRTRERQPYHLTMLARDLTGYRNLLQLVTKSNLEGFYYKPRIDRELPRSTAPASPSSAAAHRASSSSALAKATATAPSRSPAGTARSSTGTTRSRCRSMASNASAA